MMKKVLRVIAALVFSVGAMSMGVVQANAAEQERVSDGNDSYETATYLDVNGSVTDTIMDDQDVDFFRLSPSANGALTLNFQHTYRESDDKWEVSVYQYANGTYEKLIDGWLIRLTDNENVALSVLGVTQGASYYVEVMGCNYWGSRKTIEDTYTIRSVFQSSEYYEREDNDSYGAATLMQTNQAYTGTISNSDDKDFWKIQTPSNGKLTLDFEHQYRDSDDGWWVNVYQYANGTYEKLIDGWRIELKDKENVEFPVLGVTQGASYYVEIMGCNYWGSRKMIEDTYIIRNTFLSSEYWEKETNDSYATATDLSLQQTYFGVLTYKGDEDFWKITPQKSGKLGIWFGHTYQDSSNGWDVYVYQYADGEYKELSSNTVYLYDKKSIRCTDIPVNRNSIYYVKIRDRDNYYGTRNDYQLKAAYVAAQPSYLRCSTSKKQAVLLWENVQGADGYEIYCKKTKGSKYKKVATTNKNTYTYKKMARKSYTYFKVRSYVMNGNAKTYSKFSYVVKAKA